MPSGHLAVELEPLDETGWPKAMPQETIYTITDLMKRLSVTRRSIQNYLKRAVNPLPYSRAGGRPRVTETDLSAWLSREKVKEKIRIL
jgi:hypothetical protein